jgi:hypothetical protein
MRYLRGFDLKEGFERIRKIKNEKILLSKSEFENILNLKLDNFYKFSKTIIVDYAGSNYIDKNEM